MFETGTNIKVKSKEELKKTTRKKQEAVPIDTAFRSIEMSWIIFLFILMFNILVFNNAFLKAVPKGISNTQAELDALIYALGNGLLLAKILFHQNWNKAHLLSAGPIAIYFNALFLLVHLDFFGLGTYHVTMMKLLLVIMPVVGLMSLVVTISKLGNND